METTNKVIKDSWKDILELFYVENDPLIYKWSDEKRLIIEYHKWLKENYYVPTKKTNDTY